MATSDVFTFVQPGGIYSQHGDPLVIVPPDPFTIPGQPITGPAGADGRDGVDGADGSAGDIDLPDLTLIYQNGLV